MLVRKRKKKKKKLKQENTNNKVPPCFLFPTTGSPSVSRSLSYHDGGLSICDRGRGRLHLHGGTHRRHCFWCLRILIVFVVLSILKGRDEEKHEKA